MQVYDHREISMESPNGIVRRQCFMRRKYGCPVFLTWEPGCLPRLPLFWRRGTTSDPTWITRCIFENITRGDDSSNAPSAWGPPLLEVMWTGRVYWMPSRNKDPGTHSLTTVLAENTLWGTGAILIQQTLIKHVIFIQSPGRAQVLGGLHSSFMRRIFWQNADCTKLTMAGSIFLHPVWVKQRYTAQLL